MYRPKCNLKADPKNRWQQPDRVFFGFGACHILAGVFLEVSPLDDFYGEWIRPSDGFTGNHMYVTNGVLAFDFHGYSFRQNLLAKYWRGHQNRHSAWAATIEKITFPLLDTAELNKRKHLGPDQFYDDPRPRARQFIARAKPPSDVMLGQAAPHSKGTAG